MKNKPLIFIGSRYLLPELAVVAEAQGYEILGILDYQFWGNTDSICNIPVIGDERWLLDPDHHQAELWRQTCTFFVATFYHGQQFCQTDDGNIEKLRWDRIQLTKQLNLDVCNLIHPDAKVLGLNSRYSSTNIGRGIFLAQGVDLSIFDVSIGDHCQVGWNSGIGHGARLAENVLVGPYCCLYRISVGSNSYIGINSKVDFNSSLNQNISIGAWSTVWGNCTLGRDVPDNHILTSTGRCLRKYRSLAWVQV